MAGWLPEDMDTQSVVSLCLPVTHGVPFIRAQLLEQIALLLSAYNLCLPCHFMHQHASDCHQWSEAVQKATS